MESGGVNSPARQGRGGGAGEAPSGAVVEKQILESIQQLRGLCANLDNQEQPDGDHGTADGLGGAAPNLDNMVRNLHLDRRHEVLKSLEGALEARLSRAKKEVFRLDTMDTQHDAKITELEEDAQKTDASAQRQGKAAQHTVERFAVALREAHARLQHRRTQEGGEGVARLSDDELEQAVLEMQAQVAVLEADCITQIRDASMKLAAREKAQNAHLAERRAADQEGTLDYDDGSQSLLLTSPSGQKHCSGVYDLVRASGSDAPGQRMWRHRECELWLFERSGRWCVGSDPSMTFERCFIISLESGGVAPDELAKEHPDAWARLDESTFDFITDDSIQCVRHFEIQKAQDELISRLKGSITQAEKRGEVLKKALKRLKVGELRIKGGKLTQKFGHVSQEMNLVVEDILKDIRADCLPALQTERESLVQKELKHCDPATLEMIRADCERLETRADAIATAKHDVQTDPRKMAADFVVAAEGGGPFVHPVFEAVVAALAAPTQAEENASLKVSVGGPGAAIEEDWQVELNEAQKVFDGCMESIDTIQVELTEVVQQCAQFRLQENESKQTAGVMRETIRLMKERRQSFEDALALGRGRAVDAGGKAAKGSCRPVSSGADLGKHPPAVRAALAMSAGGGPAVAERLPYEAKDARELSRAFLGPDFFHDGQLRATQLEVFDALNNEKKALEVECKEMMASLEKGNHELRFQKRKEGPEAKKLEADEDKAQKATEAVSRLARRRYDELVHQLHMLPQLGSAMIPADVDGCQEDMAVRIRRATDDAERLRRADAQEAMSSEAPGSFDDDDVAILREISQLHQDCGTAMKRVRRVGVDARRNRERRAGRTSEDDGSARKLRQSIRNILCSYRRSAHEMRRRLVAHSARASLVTDAEAARLLEEMLSRQSSKASAGRRANTMTGGRSSESSM